MSSTGWTTHQLVEYLAVLFGCPDEQTAVRVGMEYAAEALEAEMVALVRNGAVEASFGVSQTALTDLARAVAHRRPQLVRLPALGDCTVIAVPLDTEEAAVLVVARIGDEPFDPEELNLVHGMARALHMSCKMVSLLEAERGHCAESEARAEHVTRLLMSLEERQTLLERLSRIQRSISHRKPLPEVLDSITAAAAELLGVDTVALHILEPSDHTHLVLMSSVGIPEDLRVAISRTSITAGAGGESFNENRLVIDEDYAHSPRALPELGPLGLLATMAAPVHEQGRPIGSLVVGSTRPGRHFSQAERDILAAFAEHASLALTDARTVEAMEHAYRDGLTGLANRSLFLERLEHLAVHNRRRGVRLALLYLDVDHFKVINDSLGHSAGDELLVQIGSRIRSCLRNGDLAGRLGGDEFAVLADAVNSPDDAIGLARRLLGVFDSPFDLGSRRVVVTASVGVALSGGARGGARGGTELLRNADVALYRAKNGGKGRFVLFKPAMYVAALERMELESDLRRAIRQNELQVHFQPIVEIASQRLHSVEALARWLHPERGLVGSADFIPIAEETGLITQIDRWVLRSALDGLRNLQQRFPAAMPLGVSVNVSAHGFRHGDMVADVADALKASGVSPGCLTLEVTESVLLNGNKTTVSALKALKNLGLRLAIDDFGAGYSSLTYLTICDFDVLKIDRAFIDNMIRDGETTPIARAILAMARILKLEVVAEGVENICQLASLRELGCQLAQGYYFARPLTYAQLEEVIRQAVGDEPADRTVIVPLWPRRGRRLATLPRIEDAHGPAPDQASDQTWTGR